MSCALLAAVGGPLTGLTGGPWLVALGTAVATATVFNRHR